MAFHANQTQQVGHLFWPEKWFMEKMPTSGGIRKIMTNHLHFWVKILLNGQFSTRKIFLPCFREHAPNWFHLLPLMEFIWMELKIYLEKVMAKSLKWPQFVSLSVFVGKEYLFFHRTFQKGGKALEKPPVFCKIK